MNMLKAGEPTEDHAMQAAWNLFTYVCTLAEVEAGRLPKELDDRTPPDPEFTVCENCRKGESEHLLNSDLDVAHCPDGNGSWSPV